MDDDVIRLFDPADAARLIEVLAATFGEYGMRFDPDGYDRDVREVERRYALPGAVFFTAEVAGRAVGFVGGDEPRPGVVEIHRLYIDPGARGRGLGARLCEAIESWARGRGARWIELWSDVRFAHAHAMYARRGFRLAGQRTLSDPDRSVEFGFRRAADGPVAPERHRLGTPRRRPLAGAIADPERAHRVARVTAAILDARSLVRAGRLVAGGHELPSPVELFEAGAREAEIDVLELELPGGPV
ncbi:MAG TPA: GNAT family N-acetyltransferase, partial [Planctomycetota bacterium]|nr:GNAT family N-acetyltransferase [Planctomycetota bacterium]